MNKLAVPSLIPQMMDYDKANSRWLVEETIKDAGNNEQKLGYFLATYSQPFYECTTRFRPVRVEITGRLMSWSNNSIKARLSQLACDGRTCWPVAFGHGDLSTGNMLLDSNGRFALCDFERASFRPVARDFTKLYIKHRNERSRILEVLGKLSGKGRTDIDANSQMAMCIALRAIRFEEILENKRAYRADKFGDEPAQFRDQILKVIRNSNLLIEGLLANVARR